MDPILFSLDAYLYEEILFLLNSRTNMINFVRLPFPVIFYIFAHVSQILEVISEGSNIFLHFLQFYFYPIDFSSKFS